MSDEKQNISKATQLSPADEETVRKIGSKLREKFNEDAAEPIPDRFTDLLNQLANKAPAQEGKSE